MERSSLLLLFLRRLLTCLAHAALFFVTGTGAARGGIIGAQLRTAEGAADGIPFAVSAAVNGSVLGHAEGNGGGGGGGGGAIVGRKLMQMAPLGQNLSIIYGQSNVIVYPPVGVILQYASSPGGGCRIASTTPYTQGTVSAVIKAPAGFSSGVACAFYLSSTLPSDLTPYGALDRDEMHFEFLGNRRTAVQTHFLVGGTGWQLNDLVSELGFDSGADFNTYTMVWTPEKLEWYVQGQLIRQVLSATQAIPSKPMYLYFTIWSSEDDAASNPGLKDWVGPYDGTSAPYQLNVPKIFVPF